MFEFFNMMFTFDFMVTLLTFLKPLSTMSFLSVVEDSLIYMTNVIDPRDNPISIFA